MRIFSLFILIWIVMAYIAVKYDYKSWPTVPGVNCINLDSVQRTVPIIVLGKNNLNIIHSALQP